MITQYLTKMKTADRPQQNRVRRQIQAQDISLPGIDVVFHIDAIYLDDTEALNRLAEPIREDEWPSIPSQLEFPLPYDCNEPPLTPEEFHECHPLVQKCLLRPQIKQRTEAFYALRDKTQALGLLFASSLASICGKNPSETAKQRQEIDLGYRAPQEDSGFMTGHGIQHETAGLEAAALYMYEYGDRILPSYAPYMKADKPERVIQFGTMQAKPGSPFFFSLDGILHRSGIPVEQKCPRKRKPNGKVPEYYLPQVWLQCHGVNSPMALYSEYVPSHPDSPWVMAVPYNPSFFQTYMYLFLCYRHQIRSQVERMGLQSLQTRMQHVQTQRTEKRMYNRTKRARQRGQSTPVMDRPDEQPATEQVHITTVEADWLLEAANGTH